jgi:hypothetical protein
MRGMPASSPRSKGVMRVPGASAVGVPLSVLIDRYLVGSGGYGKPAALSTFGLSRAEIENAFSQFEEDYMISRFLHFSRQSGESYRINGFPQTHVTIDAAIQATL